MTFPIDTTIPNAPNDPADDQPLMKDNFGNINSLFSVNHFVPGAEFNGKHQKVEMPNDDLPDDLVSGESTLYSKEVSGRSQVFFSPDDTGNEYQLTRAVTNLGNFAFFSTNPGWTFLPGGMLMQWGTNTSTSGDTINFPINFSGGAPYSIQCTIIQNTTNRHFVYVRTSAFDGFVTTQLDSNGNAESSTFSWIAIGK